MRQLFQKETQVPKQNDCYIALYTMLRKTFLKNNTVITSGVPLERLFSLGRDVLKLKQSCA